MAAEWAVIIGVALGSGGLVQFWNTHQQRKLIAEDRKHQRMTLDEQRRYETRGDAYIGLLMLTDDMLADIENKEPIERFWQAERLDLTSRERADMLAKVRAYGSPTVRGLTRKLISLHENFVVGAGFYTPNPETERQIERHHELIEERRQIAALRHEIVDRVQSELQAGWDVDSKASPD